MDMPFSPNESKQLNITTDYGVFSRYPVKTHVVMNGQDLPELLDQYVKAYVQDGDYGRVGAQPHLEEV